MSSSIRVLFCLSILSLYATQIRAESTHVKIGAMLCLSDVCSEPGQNALNGIRLALNEVNSAGGVLGKKLELVVEDTQESHSGAHTVSVFKKLRTDSEISLFIGPTWSNGGLSVAPVAAREKGIILTSPSLGVADFNETSDAIFNIWPHDDVATRALARLAVKKGWKSAVILSSQDPWESTQAKTFRESFEEMGGKVLKVFEPLSTSTNLKVIAQRTAKLAPDFIFMSNYTRVDIAARELQTIKCETPKLIVLLDDARLQAAGTALDGAIVAENDYPSKEFAIAYKKSYGEEPGIAADTGYDVLKMYVQAMKEAKSTTDIDKILLKYRDLQYSGASGSVKFDDEGGVERNPVFRIVRDQKKVPYTE